ncbi:MAG: YkgJ family cysteine cluster protein [Myxococcales bacterium]
MKLSLNVVAPPREEPVGSSPPASVHLSEPMRRFQCNQKGCCCSGWDIPFRLEDFLRLHEHLPEEERGGLTHGIRLVLGQEKTAEGEQILHSLKLDGVGDDKGCRYLATDGGCGVHRRFGLSALPDLCVDFPALGYRRGDGAVELWFDPICPEVLEQLDESDAPLRLHRQEPGTFGDAGLDLRVAHSSDRIGGRIGKHSLEWGPLDAIRAASVEAFAADRPAWRSLAAVVHAYRRLRIGNEGAFEAVEPEDPQPFLKFLGDSIAAHGADLLRATIVKYRRFIWSVDPAPIVESPDLVRWLDEWQPAFEKWLAPSEESLRPLTARWLAHRFGTPMVKGRGDLREAADCIVHVYATSLRIAAAMGAVLRKPVDRDLYKAALGAAEFFYRSLHLPREALPWFASES